MIIGILVGTMVLMVFIFISTFLIMGSKFSELEQTLEQRDRQIRTLRIATENSLITCARCEKILTPQKMSVHDHRPYCFPCYHEIRNIPKIMSGKLYDLIVKLNYTAKNEDIVCFRQFLVDNQRSIRTLTLPEGASEVWAEALGEATKIAAKRFKKTVAEL